jgi:hypothetical protein
VALTGMARQRPCHQARCNAGRLTVTTDGHRCPVCVSPAMCSPEHLTGTVTVGLSEDTTVAVCHLSLCNTPPQKLPSKQPQLTYLLCFPWVWNLEGLSGIHPMRYRSGSFAGLCPLEDELECLVVSFTLCLGVPAKPAPLSLAVLDLLVTWLDRVTANFCDD